MDRNKLNKFLFFFDSRATFAYSNNVLKYFKKNQLNYKIFVSGNYLEKQMKIDKKIFSKNKLKISAKVKFESPNNNISSWPKSFGKAMIGYAEKLSKLKPDLAIITGDRIETLAFSITCAYMNIPIAHIQAGDKSGHIDDLSRAAISKFSNIHFAPSAEACKRLISWGEDRSRIFFTGAPQLDDINPDKSQKKSDYYIVIFHPILNEQKYLNKHLNNLIAAINKTNINVIWIYPNNDVGYKRILNLLKKKNKNIKLVSNFERTDFIKILKKSKGMIGNSSAGIIEASMLKIPVLNIGNRQNGRPQSKNIVNCKPNLKSIVEKINFIKDNKSFLKSLENVKNPFFIKGSSKKVTKILMNLEKGNKLLKKY